VNDCRGEVGLEAASGGFTAVPRTQARKPLGRSQDRFLYTLPAGNSCRLVYSIDAGVAVLERAFGLVSQAEDYRK